MTLMPLVRQLYTLHGYLDFIAVLQGRRSQDIWYQTQNLCTHIMKPRAQICFFLLSLQCTSRAPKVLIKNWTSSFSWETRICWWRSELRRIIEVLRWNVLVTDHDHHYKQGFHCSFCRHLSSIVQENRYCGLLHDISKGCWHEHDGV